MTSRGPHPSNITLSSSPRSSPLGIVTDSAAGAALASETIVRGIVGLRVRYSSTGHRRQCASEACPHDGKFYDDDTLVRVTYTERRPGEDFHLLCYRWEFIS
jgi:hypothetical protein